MNNLPQKSTRVKSRFHRNCAAARKAGFNLRFQRPDLVYVNGVAVTRNAFEKATEAVLLAFLDSTFGKPGYVEFYFPEVAV